MCFHLLDKVRTVDEDTKAGRASRRPGILEEAVSCFMEPVAHPTDGQ